MKYAIRAVLFHFTCLVYFGILYVSCKDEFVSVKGEPIDLLDCFGLSTAIQSGVGEKENTIIPSTHYSKLIMIIQQFCMLSTNVFLLYFIVKWINPTGYCAWNEWRCKYEPHFQVILAVCVLCKSYIGEWLHNVQSNSPYKCVHSYIWT